jgi:hypothetical protein
MENGKNQPVHPQKEISTAQALMRTKFVVSWGRQSLLRALCAITGPSSTRCAEDGWIFSKHPNQNFFGEQTETTERCPNQSEHRRTILSEDM